MTKNRILQRVGALILCAVMIFENSPMLKGSGASAADDEFEKLLAANRLETVTPLNTQINLFDYWLTKSPTDPGYDPNDPETDAQFYNDWVTQNASNFQWTSTLRGINYHHPLLVSNGMGNNWQARNPYQYGLWNTTASSWIFAKDQPHNRSWLEGMVKPRLGEDGMPVLNIEWQETEDKNYYLSQRVYDSWGNGSKSPSLDYLFSPSLDHKGKASYVNVQGLFSVNEGTYRFSSVENYAQFIQDSTKLAGSDGYFNVYNTWAVQNGNHQGGNFAPFNTAQQVLKVCPWDSSKLWDNGVKCTQNNTNPKAYSNAATGATCSINHYFGMTMETSFIQPMDGMVQYGESGDDTREPMQFTFSGDNDVWLYIDNILVGDLGGMHSESFLIIDFAEGYIYRGPVKRDGAIPTLRAKDGSKGELQKLFENYEDGEALVRLEYKDAIDTYPLREGDEAVFSRTTIYSMYEKAGALDEQDWSGKNARTYADNTVHVLKFFYLERGGYDANLTLDFNLKSIPYSTITKVDQDGQPVPNVKFDLYAANYDELYGKTTIQKKKDENGNETDEDYLICTGFTDSQGRLILVDDKRHLIQFDELALVGIKNYVLRETYVPPGYRTIGDIPLYYENKLVFVRGYMQSGAYTTAYYQIDFNTKLYEWPEAGDTEPKLLVEDTRTMKDGIIFAVPMKVELGEGELFDPNKTETFHPVYGTYTSGFKVVADTANHMESIIIAAKQNGKVAEENTNQVYTMKMDQIPGNFRTQYVYVRGEAMNRFEGDTPDDEALRQQFIEETTKYIVCFYYAPGITKLEDLDKVDQDSIKRIDTDTQGRVETELSSDLHVPNVFNRFRVQKLNNHGDRVTDATFALYQIFSLHDHDGSGSQYLSVTYKGKLRYINTQMFDISKSDIYDMEHMDEPPAIETYILTNGKTILESVKTQEEIVADWKEHWTGEKDDNGENLTITPWDFNTTNNWSEEELKELNNKFVTGLVLDGAALFPSAYEKHPTSRSDYKINNTRTYLEDGFYILYEVVSPKNHTINPTPVHVEVLDQQIYADAGDANDGIRVGMYAAMPQRTMTTFATESAIDTTLTYVDAYLQSATYDSANPVLYDTEEGRVTYHYKFDNELGFYQRFVQTGDHMFLVNSARNLYLYTDSGHPLLVAKQGAADGSRLYEVQALNLKHAYFPNGERSGKLTVGVYDRGAGTSRRVTVNVNDGLANYMLYNDNEVVTSYSFVPSEGKDAGKTIELLTDAYKGKYVVNTTLRENITDREDISNLLTVTTVVQFFDRDESDLTVEVKVDPDNRNNPHTELEPFYFRLYAMYDQVTKIALVKWNDDGTGALSNFNGTLNVSVGQGLTTDDEDDQSGEESHDEAASYNQNTVTNLSVSFKNGVGRVYLSKGYVVKQVYLPENIDHGAYGLEARVMHQITTMGDYAGYTGTLYVSAIHNFTGQIVSVQPVEIKNGVGVYYAENNTQIYHVGLAGDKSVGGDVVGWLDKGKDYEEDERYGVGTAWDVQDETVMRTIQVDFDPDHPVVYCQNGWTKNDDSMTDVFKGEDGNFYLKVDTKTGANEFLQSHVVSGDFALYQDQSVTIHNIPCGMRVYIQEWTLDNPYKPYSGSAFRYHGDQMLDEYGVPCYDENGKPIYVRNNVQADRLIQIYDVSAEYTWGGTVQQGADVIPADDILAAEATWDETSRTKRVLVYASLEDQKITFHNRPRVGQLTVAKEVTGNMGDRQKEWTFEIQLGDHPVDNIPINGPFPAQKYMGDQTVNLYVNFTEGYAEVVLKHGESITIQDLPQGLTYSITELDYEPYTVSHQVDEVHYDPETKVTTVIEGTRVAGNYLSDTLADSTAEAAETTAPTVSYATVDDWVEDRVTFFNRYNLDVIDTGVTLDSLPYILVLGLVLSGTVFLLLRRRRGEDA